METALMSHLTGRLSRRIWTPLHELPFGLFVLVSTWLGGNLFGAIRPTSELVHISLTLDRSGLDGFIYPYDSSRVLMQVPYQLAHLLTPNSYLGISLVNFFVTGLTAFCIGKVARQLRFGIPAQYWSAGMFIFSAGDSARLFPGMMVVEFAILAWAMALLLCLRSSRLSPGLAIAFALLQVLALLVYDVIGILLIVSALILYFKRCDKFVALGWLLIPMLWIFSQGFRYFILDSTSYQSSQLVQRTLGDALDVSADLVSFAFLPMLWPLRYIGDWNLGYLAIAALGSFLVSVLIWLSLVWVPSTGNESLSTWSERKIGIWLIVFALISVACVFPYVFIASPFSPEGFPSGPWRALLIATAPLSLFFALVLERIRRQFGFALSNLGFFCMAFLGLFTQVSDQAFYRQEWSDYQAIVSSIKSEVPGVSDGSLVVVVDQSRIQAGGNSESAVGRTLGEVFRSSIWANATGQLLYPDTELVLTYIDSEGGWAPDMGMVLTENGLRITDSNVGVEEDNFPWQKILLLSYDGQEIASYEASPKTDALLRRRGLIDLTTISTGTTHVVRCDPIKASRMTPLLGELGLSAGQCN